MQVRQPGPALANWRPSSGCFSYAFMSKMMKVNLSFTLSFLLSFFRPISSFPIPAVAFGQQSDEM